ncbi:hypothetical protein BV898_04497 [Hypsibius exemplaris]|uniref:Thyroglobulin type-1 domain-containing protein n=1 Tax=Hypsibius exemplaris TaxID=2072580 RepID=A0A1W0X299_HYPEX|nr:hypothetical protein BV898_04497 [Hypsibius exemplaris]
MLNHFLASALGLLSFVFIAGLQASASTVVRIERNCHATREKALVRNAHPANDWVPECELDGTFKLHQHNVSGTPFCANSKGVLVFQPAIVTAATEISCGCPLEVFNALTKVHKMGTFIPTCDHTNGRYLPVQCHPGTQLKRTGTCYCVDEKGQNLGEKPRGFEESYCLKLRQTVKHA